MGGCPRPPGWEPVSSKTVTRTGFTIGQGSSQLLILFQLILLQCLHQFSGCGQHREGQVWGRSARFLKHDIELSEQETGCATVPVPEERIQLLL